MLPVSCPLLPCLYDLLLQTDYGARVQNACLSETDDWVSSINIEVLQDGINLSLLCRVTNALHSIPGYTPDKSLLGYGVH